MANFSAQQPVWFTSQSISTVGTRPSKPEVSVMVQVLATAVRLVLRAVTTKLANMQERRRFSALGPYGRLELDALLTACGDKGVHGGQAWRGCQEQDYELLWGRSAAVAGRVRA